MTATLLPGEQRDALTAHDKTSQDTRIARLVLLRLQQRSQVACLAREIHEGMKGAVGLFAGETDQGTICEGGSGTARFVEEKVSGTVS